MKIKSYRNSYFDNEIFTTKEVEVHHKGAQR